MKGFHISSERHPTAPSTPLVPPSSISTLPLPLCRGLAIRALGAGHNAWVCDGRGLGDCSQSLGRLNTPSLLFGVAVEVERVFVELLIFRCGRRGHRHGKLMNRQDIYFNLLSDIANAALPGLRRSGIHSLPRQLELHAFSCRDTQRRGPHHRPVRPGRSQHDPKGP
ncbi:hypothetical protein OE88DRAFT_813853 [Heliocybe sulcata]|uniref:Uncharacterized protein n=1 Tax=Heliocybe sulcata TaxID=5364 RepID=A0A5C3MP75_9AGAM|nr:hypothetical protein OE88DRAFT_813853 [Heliocybe sulcata]